MSPFDSRIHLVWCSEGRGFQFKYCTTEERPCRVLSVCDPTEVVGSGFVSSAEQVVWVARLLGRVLRWDWRRGEKRSVHLRPPRPGAAAGGRVPALTPCASPCLPLSLIFLKCRDLRMA